jgi:putative spermidine/putrescine transport system substrate-binding protein
MKLKKRGLVAGASLLTLIGTAALPGTATAAPRARLDAASLPTSAAGYGGMAKLVAAAKKEGTLNVITLPADWANYGNIIKDFSSKYGIKINSANPDGTSADEINAVKTLKGQSRAPDVLDLGTSFAVSAASTGLLAPYKVASWNEIPATAKDANGDWFDDYGGYVAIGYNSAKVKVAPTSFKSLLNPIYKNEVALNGSPTEASAAFSAVYAAALANGGSFSNIQPGINYFAKLHQVGNFVPVTGSPTTVENGTTPILIWWDYLQASEVAKSDPNWKVVIPTDGHYAAYYSQAISASAPHPAAARLWEEYLYSSTGQNLWLQGAARPIELSSLIKDGTVDKAANAALPPAPKGPVKFPSIAQQTAAQALVTAKWAAATGG